jgi:8-oxo-dGTP diphosphatase
MGFPLARCWWHLLRPRHQGALVAIHVGQTLLLLRSSYRLAWNFPGGTIRAGETPDAAAKRELVEEIGLPVHHLIPAGQAEGIWDGRRNRVHFFELHLDHPPELRLDNREIVSARLVSLDECLVMVLTGPVRVWLERPRSPP